MKTLVDRVAVVTGAASGIGFAASVLLARKGCDVALVDVNAAGLEDAAKAVLKTGRKASIHVVDVSKRAAMEQLAGDVIAQHGRVHVVLNNAGVATVGTIGDVPLDDFEWLMGINFWGVVHGCQVFLPHLLKEDEGHIVNVSSCFGFIGMPENGPYCASKFAVRGLSETLQVELSGTNVGVTSVHPGGVKTNIVAGSRTNDPEQKAELVGQFERAARMSPERAAERIVRAIERNKPRLRFCAESYLIDWFKRALPNTTTRLLSWAYRRGQLSQ